MSLLTSNAVARMYNGITVENPILQIIDIRKVVSEALGERYRLVLSDGDKYMHSMLATQLSSIAANNTVIKFSVVRLTDYVINNVANGKVVIIMDCTKIEDLSKCIGQPTSVAPIPNKGQRQQSSNPPPPPQESYNNNNRSTNKENNNNNSYNNNNSRNTNGERPYVPVSALNPYQKSWTIKVRVTKKDTMRTYTNKNGEGKVFSVDLLDSEGTEIRATCFRDAAETFYSVLIPNHVYYMSKGTIQVSNKKYTHIKNDYAIILNRDSEVIPVNEDDSNIKQQSYKFVPIGSLTDIPSKSYVDIIGIIQKADEIQTLQSSKTNRELTKRSLVLMDKSGKVNVTLWDEFAKKFSTEQLSKYPVLALKAALVSDFGGRSINANGDITLQPNVNESHILNEWRRELEMNGKKLSEINIESVSNGGNKTDRLYFKQVKALHLEINKNTWFDVKGRITAISHQSEKPPYYEACPGEHCNAKVMQQGNEYLCQNHRISNDSNERTQMVYNNCNHRYILRFCVTGFSGQQWLSCFNDVAEQILGVNANTCAAYLKNDENEAYEKVFNSANFQSFIFRVRATKHSYQDREYDRYTVQSVKKLTGNDEITQNNVQNEMKYLMNQIQQLEPMQTIN